jgi:hypothetical protein
MAKLVELFSDLNLSSKARFRRGVETPEEFDVWFETITEEMFGDSKSSDGLNGFTTSPQIFSEQVKVTSQIN